MRRYDASELHWLLIGREPRPDRHEGAQALFCPYYVPLEGRLGADWGVIVNPESSRFGLLTFEHADCGCPRSDSEDDAGWGRHAGDPSQEGDTWWDGWQHVCDDVCDDPCDWLDVRSEGP
jgi:hypothetical protein